MTLEQFLTLLATILGAIGSVYVLKSILRITPEMTERLSTTFYNHNLNQLDSLSEQKAESMVGAIIIIIALFTAIVNAATTPSTITVHQNRLCGISFVAVLSVFVWLVLFLVGKVIKTRHQRAAARIIAGKTLDGLFARKNTIPTSEIKSLQHLNDRYFHLECSSNNSSRDFLRKISRVTNRVVPEDIQIEGETHQ